MKLKLAKRSDYEAYFMPIVGNRPQARRIRAFLEANHPFYDRAKFDVFRMKREIRGKDYLLLTVFPKRKKQSVVTATAIISASSLARDENAVKTEDEILIFSDAPRSSFLSPERIVATSAPTRLTAEEEILSLMEREKIPLSRVRGEKMVSRGAAVGALAVTIFAAALASLFGARAMRMGYESPAVDESARVTSGLTTPAILERDECAFPEYFKNELNAAISAGSVIEDYQFSRWKAEGTELTLSGGRPDFFVKALNEAESQSMVNIPRIEYRSGNASYTATIARAERSLRPVPTDRTVTAGLEKDLIESEYRPSRIEGEGERTIEYDIEGNRLAATLRYALACGARHGFVLERLSVGQRESPDRGKRTTLVTITLYPGDGDDSIDRVEGSLIDRAFGVAAHAQRNSTPSQNESKPYPAELPLIGKITEDSQTTIRFRMDDHGKIFAEESQR